MFNFKEKYAKFQSDFYKISTLNIFILIGYSMISEKQSRLAQIVLPIISLIMGWYGVIVNAVFAYTKIPDIAVVSGALCPCITAINAVFRTMYFLKYKFELRQFRDTLTKLKNNQNDQRYSEIYSNMTNTYKRFFYTFYSVSVATATFYSVSPVLISAYELIRFGVTSRKLPVETVLVQKLVYAQINSKINPNLNSYSQMVH